MEKKIDKFKLFRIIKKNKENELKRGIAWNDRFFVKQNDNQNRVNLNKSKTHIRIKSRDIKNINLNIYTDDESKTKTNIASNVKTGDKILSFKKTKITPNKTFSNLLISKLHQKEKKNKINSNKKRIDQNDNSQNYKKILNLWEELGVNYIYRKIFKKITSNLKTEKRENYYLYEFNKLNDINNIIHLIITDINNREEIILKLQKIFEKDKNFEENINKDNLKEEEIIKEILSELIDLRKYSIDIVNNIILLRKKICYDIIMNKYDINKIFLFPHDYLIKMNHDLDFLIYSRLNKYFNFSKADPFFKMINISNKNYNLPELDANKIQLINKFENLIMDELINQEVNLMTMNSKGSFDSIFNFESKNRIIKRNNTKISNQLNLNLNKRNSSIKKIIKANRGLSRQKLRPKINNKIFIDSDVSNTSKEQENKFSLIKLNKYNSKTMNRIYNNKIKKQFLINEKSRNKQINEESKEIQVKYNKSQQKLINDNDLKIFEKFIEQSILEKNNIDEIYLNRINKKLNKNEDNTTNSNTTNKKKEYEIEINTIKDETNINKKEKNLKKKDKKKDKISNKDISNFIKDIIEESEIENSQKISISRKNISKSNLEDIEKETRHIKKIYSNYIIELYNDKLSSLKEIYNNYYRKILEKIKIGFNIKSNIMKYIEGIYPKVILIKSNKNNSQLLGVVTLNYISNSPNNIIVGGNKLNSNYNKILNISGISCLDESQFSDILINTIDLCEEYFYFENITLQLFYLNKNGQFILYSDLEKIIKNNAKFKWVNMENDGINRKIKYKYINSNTNKNSCKYTNNIINLKSINIIGYEEEKNYKINDIRNLSFINDFSINYLLLEMIGQNNFKVSDKIRKGNNFINSLIKKTTFKKMNQLCSNFLISQLGESTDIKNFIKENQAFLNNNELVEKIDERIFYESYFSSAIININNSFKNIIKRKYNGFIYNILFNDQINEFIIKDINNKDMKFYLINSNDQNISIIIYEFKKDETLDDIKQILFNDDKNSESEDEEKNISEIFKELFSKVTKKPTKINKNIYIPSFKIISDRLVFRPSVFSNVILENEKIQKKYKINCLNYIEELTFGIDESYIMDFDVDIGENIIIQNDFIISLVNNDLIYEFQIPTISTFLVQKSYWIKSS